jgi:hypothetical protein
MAATLIGALPPPEAAAVELEPLAAGALEELDALDELPQAVRPMTNRSAPSAANHEVFPFRKFMLLSSPWGLIRPNFHG